MRVLALLSVLAACSSAPPPDYNVLPRPPPEGWGQIRVVHAAASLNSVDVYVSALSDPVLGDLSYGFAEGFVEIAAMAYTLQLRPAGETLDNAPIYSQDTTLASEERKTLVLSGDAATMQFTEFTDDVQRVDPGSLHVVNASAANATLDFTSDGTAEITGLAPNTASRATTPSLLATTLTVNGTVYALPARPSDGDVLVVIADTEIMLVTYSFTIQILQPQ